MSCLEILCAIPLIREYLCFRCAIIDYTIETLQTDYIDFSEVYDMAGEGGTPSTSNMEYYENGCIPFVKIEDLKQKYLVSNKDHITELGLQKSSAWLIPTNSILFSNGATIGEISITTYPVCTKQGILGIVPKVNFDTEYLYYLMSSRYFKREICRIITEGTMKTAYLKDINKIRCPIPSKAIQQEIVSLPSVLDTKIEIEQRILEKFICQKQYLLSPDVHMNIWRSRYCFCSSNLVISCSSTLILSSSAIIHFGVMDIW